MVSIALVVLTIALIIVSVVIAVIVALIVVFVTLTILTVALARDVLACFHFSSSYFSCSIVALLHFICFKDYGFSSYS